MPIYEYKCTNGHVFEVMQSFSDDPLTTCTECGAPVQKVLHPVSVHFKGKGFYNTDYGTKRRAREARENKESAANSGSGSDGAATSTSDSSSSSDGASGSSSNGDSSSSKSSSDSKSGSAAS